MTRAQRPRTKWVKIRRGEVVVGAGKGDEFGRPRACVVVQADTHDKMDSVLVCPTTKHVGLGFPIRIPLAPGISGPLASDIEVDKLAWILRARVDQVVGHLADDDMRQVDAALLALLDLKKYLPSHNP